MCPQDAVRTTGQLDEPGSLDHFRLPPGGGLWWQNAVGIAVQDESGHVIVRDVLAEVLNPRVNTRQRPGSGCAYAHVPVVFEYPLAHELPARDVVVVEVV